MADCAKWGVTGILWKNANWFWSACGKIPPVPVIEIGGIQPSGVDASTLVQPWQEEPWNPYKTEEKKKRMIKLICKIKGVEYDEEKEVKDFKISIDDVRMLMNGIGADVKMKE